MNINITEEDIKKGQEDFEYMRNLAELKALSNFSLENPLTDYQYERIMMLKVKVLDVN